MRCDLGTASPGVEKLAENEMYNQFLVYTDRMDYISALCSNQAWVVAVERLLGIEDLVPEKAKYIRTMMSELQRINSHLLWLGTYALDIGALTIFLYAFKEREKIMDIVEGITGARLTISYPRIGGVRMDLPEGALEVIKAFVKRFPKELRDWETHTEQEQDMAKKKCRRGNNREGGCVILWADWGGGKGFRCALRHKEV
jgi:NADH-quinone oxidoreductase subunit C/D